MRRLGVHSSLFHQFSVAETCDTLAQLGYGAIELNLEDCEHFTAHTSAAATTADRAEIVRSIQKSGLHLSSISAHACLIDARDDARCAAQLNLAGAIELAADLGTDIVHVISGFQQPGASEQQSWEWMTDAVRSAVERGRQRMIRIAVEAAVFPGFLVWNFESLQHLIERVDATDLYVNFDPSHFQAAGDDVVRAFETLRGRIIHMHAKDARGTRQRFEFPALGDGLVDWPGLANAMTRTRYDGTLSVEYEAHFFSKGYSGEPIAAARQSKEFLDRTLGQWLSG
jgi:sugar phosphate isomerase/epimerase